MILVGICGALVSPTTMAFVPDIVPATERSAAIGEFNVFGSLGMLSGFIIGGTVTELYGYLPVFIAAGGLEITIVFASKAVWKITSPNKGHYRLDSETQFAHQSRIQSGSVDSTAV